MHNSTNIHQSCMLSMTEANLQEKLQPGYENNAMNTTAKTGPSPPVYRLLGSAGLPAKQTVD